jgi:transcriptional regulator with XRE-family HTH domain
MLDRAIGEVIRRVREERGLSQADLSQASGLHRTYISQLERGLKSPTLSTIGKLATVLKLSASSLVKRAEETVEHLAKSS